MWQAERPYLFRGWSQIVEAFVAGQVDVIHVLMPTAVWMRFAQDIPVRIVAWNHTDGSAFTVDPGVDRVDDLAGQTVAIPYWYSVHNVVLQQLLRHHGLRPAEHAGERLAADEVRLVVMAPSDMPAALANRSIAGYIVAEPFNAAAEVMEVGKILRFTGDVWLEARLLCRRDERGRPRAAPGMGARRGRRCRQSAAVDERASARSGPASLSEGEGICPSLWRRSSGPSPTTITSITARAAPSVTLSGATPASTSSRTLIPRIPRRWSASCRATYVEGERAFLERLNPDTAHRQLVDDTFVRKALDQVGGLTAFGLPEQWTRTEVISL